MLPWCLRHLGRCWWIGHHQVPLIRELPPRICRVARPCSELLSRASEVPFGVGAPAQAPACCGRGRHLKRVGVCYCHRHVLAYEMFFWREGGRAGNDGVSRRGRAPCLRGAGTWQERPPHPCDNARPDPAAGLDTPLQLPVLRFSPPAKWERGAPAKPPRAAGRLLACPRRWGAVGHGVLGVSVGSPCSLLGGFMVNPWG